MPGIARPSVASLLLRPQFQGQPLSTATGFVVQQASGEPPLLFTNWHVVTGRRPNDGSVMSQTGGVPDELGIFHNETGALGRRKIKIERLYDGQGQPVWREHPTLRRAVDVVALPLKELDGVDLYPHDPRAVGPSVAIVVAGPLSIVGFPFGLTGGGALGIWVQGTIATEPEVGFNGLPCFLIDSRTRPGQSGSPVLFYSSGGAVSMADGSTAVLGGPVERLLGIYSGRINDQSDLGFVWMSEAVREVAASGVPGEI